MQWVTIDILSLNCPKLQYVYSKSSVWESGGWPVVDMPRDTTLDQYYDPKLFFGCMTFVWIARSECKTQTDTAIRHRWKLCTHYSSHLIFTWNRGLKGNKAFIKVNIKDAPHKSPYKQSFITKHKYISE